MDDEMKDVWYEHAAMQLALDIAGMRVAQAHYMDDWHDMHHMNAISRLQMMNRFDTEGGSP